MKYKFLLLLCCTLHFGAIAQPENPEVIMAGMAQKITDALRRDPSLKEATVTDFTKNEGNSSLVGNYFTELFIDGLINANNRTFEYLPMESLNTKNPAAFWDVLNTTLGVLTYDPNNPRPESSNAGNKQNTGKTKFKKLDVIISGSITEFSEHFEVFVEAKNHRQDDKVISRDRKQIPKTFHLRELLEKEKATTSQTGAPPQQQNQLAAVASFPKGDLLFELLECKQNGRMIACQLRIANNGRQDIELYAYGTKGSKIFSAAGGIEYDAIAVKLAEVTNEDSVKKIIVANTHISAFVTFGNVVEPVSRIAKLDFRCWADGSGHFNAEFRNITVKR